RGRWFKSSQPDSLTTRTGTKYSHSAPPSEGSESPCVDPEELDDPALDRVRLGQPANNPIALTDDHDAQPAQPLKQRRPGRGRTGPALRVEPAQGLVPQLPPDPPPHQGQAPHVPP